MSTPLNYGDLSNVADLDVCADTEGNYVSPIYWPIGFVPIIDAECEIVCYAPKDRAELLVRLINTYRAAKVQP